MEKPRLLLDFPWCTKYAQFLSSCKITDLIVKTDSVSFCISIFIEMEMETVLIMVNYMKEGSQIEREGFWLLEPEENKTFWLLNRIPGDCIFVCKISPYRSDEVLNSEKFNAVLSMLF